VWTQQQVEEEEAEKLTWLSLTDAEYQQLIWEGKREFWYHNVIHDLKVATQEEGGNWKILCFRDEHETKMLRLAQKAMQTNHEEDDGPPTSSLQSSSLYTLQAELFIPAASSNRLAFCEYADRLMNPISDIAGPPPQWC
jgi:hypothetical protein